MGANNIYGLSMIRNTSKEGKNMKLKLLVILVLFVTILTSCQIEQDVVELSFRITWDITSERGETMKKVVSRFNNTQNEVFVTLVGGNEDFEETKVVLEGEEGPEVLVMPYRFVQYFGGSGDLLEVDSIIEDELDYHYESILDMATVNDVTFGVPWVGHSMAILYNESILSEAGIDPSSIIDFDTLGEALAKVEANTNKSGIGLVGADHHDVSWMTTQFIHSFGGELVDMSNAEITINSDLAKEGLEYYLNVLGSYAQDDWENHTGIEVMESFRNQEVAFEIQGPWGVTDIWKAGNPFEVGTISFNDLGGCSEVGPLMLSIQSDIDGSKMAAANSFINYLSSKNAMEIIMVGEYSPKNETFYPFRVPVRKDMLDLQFFEMFPEFISFMDGFENPSINSPCPEWTEIHELYYEAEFHQVVIGEMTIEEFLIDIETQGNYLLD